MALQLSVRSWTGAIVNLEPKLASTKLEIFKALALFEIKDSVPYGWKISILHDDVPLVGKTLADHGLMDGDTLRFELVPPTFSESGDEDADPAKNDATFIRDQLLSCPQEVMLLQKTNPPLAKAFLMGDFETFSDLVKEILCKAEKKRDAKLEAALRQIGEWKSPMATKASKSSAPLPKLDVNANILPPAPKAQDVFPMKNSCEGPKELFVGTKVNGIGIKAYVDPGAKLTTMSKSCANRTKILSFLETTGPSSGKTYLMMASAAASTSPLPKSVGKIRNFNIEIGGKFIMSTFTVVDVQKWDFVLGEDFLKIHECVIELGRNLMKIGSSGVETPFISEGLKIPSSRTPSTSSNLKEANPSINSN